MKRTIHQSILKDIDDNIKTFEQLARAFPKSAKLFEKAIRASKKFRSKPTLKNADLADTAKDRAVLRLLTHRGLTISDTNETIFRQLTAGSLE